MEGKTHAVVGAALGACIGSAFLDNSNAAAVTMMEAIAAGSIGGLLPDSDLPRTKGRKYLVSGVLALAVGTALGFNESMGAFSNTRALFCKGALLSVWWIFYLVIVLKEHSHRGFTHSLTALLCSAIVLFLMPESFRLFSLTFTAGMLSHLLLDLFNTKGEQLFWPLNKRFCLNLCSSSGFTNKVIFVTSSFCLIAEVALVGKSDLLDLIRSVM